jgi:hypothetical protein
VFFFETQLHGDGPGPDFLRDHGDVAMLLADVTRREPVLLMTDAVHDRAAERSLWMLQ